MNKFKEDVKLLAELDAEIRSAEAAANPPEIAASLVSAIMPGAGKMMPVVQKASRQRLDTLQRARTRLAQLIDKEHNQ